MMKSYQERAKEEFGLIISYWEYHMDMCLEADLSYKTHWFMKDNKDMQWNSLSQVQ